MKQKKPILLISFLAFILLGAGWFFLGVWHISPLHGKLRTVTVTMKYFSSTTTNSDGLNTFEKTVVIQDPDELAAIERSLASVQTYHGVNSMEGLPKYRMKVEYIDGKTETFGFTKTEWGGSGFTPDSLLKELEKNGL